MKRDGRIIEITEAGVTYLWEKIYGTSLKESGLGLKTAAEAVLITYGAEKIALELEIWAKRKDSENPSSPPPG